MTWLVTLPFLVQGIAMAVDELYFHRARGLPLWERIGHPVDTLSVIACVACAVFWKPGREEWGAFLALACFSCLLITKDEFVHRRECSGGEQWLHAVLFVLHPVCLGAVAWLWAHPEAAQSAAILRGQLVLLISFGLYQAVYWGILWKPSKKAVSTRSTTRSTIRWASAGTPLRTIRSRS